MEDEDFLAAVEADNAIAPAEEPKPEPEIPAEEEAPKPEAEAPAPAEPAPAEPQPEAPLAPEAEKGPIMVPLSALHETRDEVKALKAELAKLQPQPQAPPVVEAPDPFEDPEGFAAFQTQQIQQIALNTTLNISEEMARASHGAEAVDAAQEWAKRQFQSNPSMYAEFIRQRNPYGYLVQQHQRQRALDRLGSADDLDAFLAWKAAQAQLTPVTPAPPNPVPPIPPRSLASAPSAGGVLTDVMQSDEEMFEETFGKKA